jgi:DNA-binding CsgD family transcriptional regulator
MNQEAIDTLSLLTDRQREVAVLAAQGLSSDQIGGRLFISAHTVKVHLYNAYQAIGIKKNTQLSVLCTLAGLVTDWRVGDRNMESRA